MGTKKYLSLLFILIALFSLLTVRETSSGKVYKWTDKEGNIHITDHPPPNSDKKQGTEVLTEDVPDITFDKDLPQTLFPFLLSQAKKISLRYEKALKTLYGLPSSDAALFFIIAVILVILHCYYALCLYLFSRKMGIRSAWLAWIPLVNSFLLVDAGGKSWWWALLFMLPIAGIIPPLVSLTPVFIATGIVIITDLVLIGIIWMRICYYLWLDKRLGLLIFVPVAQLILMGYLAFKQEPQNE